MDTVSEESLGLRAEPHVLDLVVVCPLHSHVHDENHYTIGKLQYVTYTQSHTILHSTVNVGSTNNFCRQKLDYCALSLFGGIHGTIVNCYLASASVNNTLPLSSVYQISPDIHCHLPGKSQSSTAGNNGPPTSVPLSLGHALYVYLSNSKFKVPCISTPNFKPTAGYENSDGVHLRIGLLQVVNNLHENNYLVHNNFNALCLKYSFIYH